MKIYSTYKYARSSDQKLRLVLKSLDFNKSIDYIINFLSFSNKKSAFLIKKTIKSALSNAEHNYKFNIKDLRISNILINKGPYFKRILPRAKGRVNYIKKKTSHITVKIININKSV